jgi:hypothetical protein
MHAANLQFCSFLLFGANVLQIRKNDCASRLAEILSPMTFRFAKMIMRADSQIWKKGVFHRLGKKPQVGLL